MLIPGAEKAFRDTSGWEYRRLLKDFPGFLEHYSSKSQQTRNLSVASKKKGAPHTIVITSAGLRAADVTRFVFGHRHLLRTSTLSGDL